MSLSTEVSLDVVSNRADTSTISRNMANSTGNQSQPTFHTVMTELERLVSARADLMTPDRRYDDVYRIGGIILQKIEILKTVSAADSDDRILQQVDRLATLRSRLYKDTCQYGLYPSRHGWCITVHLDRGRVLDGIIIDNLMALDGSKPPESFTTGLYTIERLAKVSKALRDDGGEHIHRLLNEKLKLLALGVTEGVSTIWRHLQRKRSS